MVRRATPEEVQEAEDVRYLDGIRSISKFCDERGFHRVQKAPEGKEPAICYDCSLPIFACYEHMKYRIVALEDLDKVT